jgi:hypothetical protein
VHWLGALRIVLMVPFNKWIARAFFVFFRVYIYIQQILMAACQLGAYYGNLL